MVDRKRSSGIAPTKSKNRITLVLQWNSSNPVTFSEMTPTQPHTVEYLQPSRIAPKKREKLWCCSWLAPTQWNSSNPATQHSAIMPVPPSLPEMAQEVPQILTSLRHLIETLKLHIIFSKMEALLSKVSGRIKSYELTCFRNCVKQTAWVPWPMTLTCCCTDPGPTMHFGHMCNCLLPDLRSSPSPPYRQNMQCLSSKYFDSLNQFFSRPKSYFV